MATLTYVYVDSTAVLGPLAIRAEPHGYDLCARHAGALSVPLGWEVIRLAIDTTPAPAATTCWRWPMRSAKSACPMISRVPTPASPPGTASTAVWPTGVRASSSWGAEDT